MTATLSSLAADANKFLTRDRARDIVLPVDGAPQWFADLCHAAHGDMMPDDWKYEFVQDALNAIENDDREDACPDVDALYPYTFDRLKWLASHLDRPGFCDEAMEEFGCEFTTTANLIALGMSWELDGVYRAVRNALEARLEDEAD